jgi:hypothetical protein
MAVILSEVFNHCVGYDLAMLAVFGYTVGRPVKYPRARAAIHAAIHIVVTAGNG